MGKGGQEEVGEEEGSGRSLDRRPCSLQGTGAPVEVPLRDAETAVAETQDMIAGGQSPRSSATSPVSPAAAHRALLGPAPARPLGAAPPRPAEGARSAHLPRGSGGRRGPGSGCGDGSAPAPPGREGRGGA